MSAAEFTDTFTVAIEGFSAVEREALASVFRLAAQRSPTFQRGEEAGVSDFLIADADSAAAVAAAHSLKGAAASLGIESIRSLAETVEQAGAASVPAAARKALPVLADLLDQLAAL